MEKELAWGDRTHRAGAGDGLEDSCAPGSVCQSLRPHTREKRVRMGRLKAPEAEVHTRAGVCVHKRTGKAWEQRRASCPTPNPSLETRASGKKAASRVRPEHLQREVRKCSQNDEDTSEEHRGQTDKAPTWPNT